MAFPRCGCSGSAAASGTSADPPPEIRWQAKAKCCKTVRQSPFLGIDGDYTESAAWRMPKPPLASEVIRKTIALPADLWADVAEFRHVARCGTEAEAFRRLIVAGLKAESEGRKTNS